MRVLGYQFNHQENAPNAIIHYTYLNYLYIIDTTHY
jgi:hypothetical protein